MVPGRRSATNASWICAVTRSRTTRSATRPSASAARAPPLRSRSAATAWRDRARAAPAGDPWSGTDRRGGRAGRAGRSRAAHPRPVTGGRRAHPARAHAVAELLEGPGRRTGGCVQRLVERDAEVELVGARIDVAAGELLGRHGTPACRARARRGEIDIGGARGLARAGRGQPEVGDAVCARRCDQAVVGLKSRCTMPAA